MIQQQRLYRIGVDVGGTNTDAALVAATFDDESAGSHVEVVDSSKKPTTEIVTDGICASIQDLLDRSRISRHQIDSINIGTTHFINAIVQADAQKLARVAVIRLCGPFCREVSPFADFPAELRVVIEGPVWYIDGGLEIDGRKIADVRREQVEECGQAILSAGISSVVVNGVFAPLDSSDKTQEEEVKAILDDICGHIDVVCSREIGRLGFLERENASILNAAVLELGRQTIAGFQAAVDSFGIDCPLYLTQNDGTVLDAASAARTPIRTFSSGATNSLMGAIFLSGIHDADTPMDLTNSQVVMCDIGGTTSDFAALSPTGLPRQSPATVKIGGVRTSFSMPEVMSIGLGGGSRVAFPKGLAEVGPLSVGHRLLQESRCFGGDVLTATDIALLSDSNIIVEADTSKIDISPASVGLARQVIRSKLERGIDAMKTSDAPVVLLLVGGGSVIATETLQNVSQCIRPKFSQVANAVGAAIAKISGDIDMIIIPGKRTIDDVKTEISNKAVQAAIDRGALKDTIQILELDVIPLQYVNNGAVRVIAKAVGELGWARGFDCKMTSPIVVSSNPRQQIRAITRVSSSNAELDLTAYQPQVSKASGEWAISATDLLFIYEGTGVLGTGGGGSGYLAYLSSLAALKKAPNSMRVIDPAKLRDDAHIAAVAYVGAPSVSNERLCADNELEYATEALARYKSIDAFSGVLAAEIGGSNGMRTFSVATALGIPVIDTDTMGRAFPRVDMSLPFVYDAATPAPSVVSDGRGNTQIIGRIDSAKRFEDSVRAIAIELGLYTGMAMSFTGDVVRQYCCHRTLSAAWYIGRSICIARQTKSSFVDALVKEVPGCQSLFNGKVVDISRSVEGGWTVGTVTLEPDNESTAVLSSPHPPKSDGPLPMELKFQNEFIYAALLHPDGTKHPLCTTPDLIAVLDQQGTAVGTHELRYGLRVSVIAMPCHPLWKTERAMGMGGPAAFQLPMEYKEYNGGFYRERSVIEEFGV